MNKTSNLSKYKVNENSSNPKKNYDQQQTKCHRKSPQNEINKTMETPNLHPIPTKSHNHTHQGIKNTFNMTPISHSEVKLTQKYTDSIPVKSNNKFHNSHIPQHKNQVKLHL